MIQLLKKIYYHLMTDDASIGRTRLHKTATKTCAVSVFEWNDETLQPRFSIAGCQFEPILMISILATNNFELIECYWLQSAFGCQG